MYILPKLKCIYIYIYIYICIEQTLWLLFMDSVQLPQGCRSTVSRQSTFNHIHIHIYTLYEYMNIYTYTSYIYTCLYVICIYIYI